MAGFGRIPDIRSIPDLYHHSFVFSTPIYLSSISISGTSEEATEKEDTETNDATEKKVVVPVAVIDEGEKKGLEDWLDEFLGD